MNGFVSGQDLFTVLGNIGRNPTGRGNAWNFMRSNWNFFYERYRVYILVLVEIQGNRAQLDI